MAQVALSTMWGLGRFKGLGDFFREGQAVGFTRFELNHGVNSAMLRGIDLKNGFKIASVHEPCPADISTGTLKARNWLISAPDENDRQTGVAAVKHSIDMARDLGATVVIVHPGRVDADAALESNLYRMYRQGGRDTAEYGELKARLIEARAAQAPANLAAVRTSLCALGEYARQAGIKLGLENRFHYLEIPLADELEQFLSLGYDDVIGYWHDVGHAQVLENLGFGSQREWLERLGPRIVGTHLHDVIGIDDHRAAGSGTLDWDLIARHLPADALRTCEFQNDNSPEQVAAGVQWLVDHGCVQA